MSGDAQWSNVSLLLRCNGSNGSTTFTDESSAARTITVVGNAQVTTTDPKYGSGSATFDGSGDRLTAALSSALHLATGDFTIECWVKRSAATAATILNYGTSSFYAWQLSLASGGQPTFNGTNSSGAAVTVSAGSVPLNTWTHLAATRSGSTFRLFVNGTQVSSNSSSDSMYPSLTGASLSIGAAVGGSATLNGQLDDIRITTGHARYTANFTAPAAELPVGLPPNEGFLLAPGPLGDAALLGVQRFGILLADGPLGAPALVGVQRYGFLAAPGPLGSPSLQGAQSFGYLLAPGPLGAPAALGSQRYGALIAAGPLGTASLLGQSPVVGALLVAGPLGTPTLRGWHDFTGAVSETAEILYVCDLVTPTGLVRLPIPSWQATIQTEQANYAQCVVPAVLDFVDSVAAATEFIISRRARLTNGAHIEYEMVRAPIDTRSFAQGPKNYTATLSGYFDALSADSTAPPAALDRPLQGVRSVTEGDGSIRLRCDVDWLLRPGMRAVYGSTELVVDWINYYVPGNDQYMDIGERA